MTGKTSTATLEKTALVLPDTVAVKNALEIQPPDSLHATPGQDPELDARADEYVNRLLDFNPGDADQENSLKASVEQMGGEVQKRAAKQSELLRQPVKKLAERGGDGGPVANALVDLKMQVEELDPGKFDFEPGWFSRALGALPGVGTPLKRYFTKFESAQTVIAAITRSLEDGRDQLNRDNVTLLEDQKQMRETGKKLERAIALGQLMDQKLQYKLDRDIPAGDPKHKFVAEELVFPLRQRIMDLQQQLAVSQQGVIATEIIMRNNKELSRGVNRALNVTITALETAASVAMALANQKIVLDKVNAVNKTTSDLIAGTAARLKTQGTEIHKQAASASLDMNALKNAFQDLKIAMEEVSTFRMNALPQMAGQILELDNITRDAEKTIQKMEEGNRARPQVRLEIDATPTERK
ncbi:MAG: toxic anion resistance protein [Bdellovibrionaceae bacterium]|nr:toxic anion resistance protein [Pseudobdellovibrionaceae bacterium]